jgi:hypothetical protein
MVRPSVAGNNCQVIDTTITFQPKSQPKSAKMPHHQIV